MELSKNNACIDEATAHKNNVHEHIKILKASWCEAKFYHLLEGQSYLIQGFQDTLFLRPNSPPIMSGFEV